MGASRFGTEGCQSKVLAAPSQNSGRFGSSRNGVPPSCSLRGDALEGHRVSPCCYQIFVARIAGMISRRDLLGSMLALTGEMSLRGRPDALSPAATRPEAASEDDLTQFVKIAIGTGGHGHTYPGATVPFGMVQLSPDTFNDGWDWCSGYHRSDGSIMGFSHTH